MYSLEISPEVDKIFKKLEKKNKKQLIIIFKKIEEIRENPYGYKFLRKPLQGFNRVHIDKQHVLIFSINHIQKTIIIHYYDHHDYVYKWQP